VHAPVPRPAEREIDDFYRHAEVAGEWEVEHYMEVGDARLVAEGPFLDKLARLRGGTGVLLEVGTAGGWLLQAAQRLGWEVAGIEAAPKFQLYACEQLGLDVRLGTVRDHAAAFLESADVVILRDVLEHLWDPIRDLTLIQSMLKPGGWLVIETPNIDSWPARLYGLKWRQIVGSHTYYWTRHSLDIAVRTAGLRPVHWSEPRYWDPDPKRERVAKAREFLKLAARFVALHGYVRPSQRRPALRGLPERLSGGRLDHTQLSWKIGDQPVLGDVLLCAARRPG
jgi:SAM-dependent methyltransferase